MPCRLEGVVSAAKEKEIKRMIPYIAGVIMAAGAAFCIFAGPWPFAGLVAVMGVLMAYEHATIVFGPDRKLGLVLESVALASAPMLMVAGMPLVAFAVVGATGLATTFLAKSTGKSKRWGGGAVAYIGAALIAVVWLHGRTNGAELTLWLFASIWVTDSFAQIVGRTVGGPKLAPIVSPNKTWSGLLGGMAGAGALGVALGVFLQSGVDVVIVLGGLGLLIALIGQIGDLLESAFKRHFDVKDSSNLIPGHGGVLDRVDGLALAAITLVTLVMFLGLGPLETIAFG